MAARLGVERSAFTDIADGPTSELCDALRGSDLKPVVVLIAKATCEIPLKFTDRPPVNPDADPYVTWRGAQGLAEDVRGRWMRGQAGSGSAIRIRRRR